MRAATVKIEADMSRVDGAVKDAAALTRSLDRLLKRVLRVFRGLRAKDFGVSAGKATLRAGDLVCVPQIVSRDFELAVRALRALDLEGAHKILDGVERPKHGAGCGRMQVYPGGCKFTATPTPRRTAQPRTRRAGK